jgi:hypothetical protein
MPCAVVAIPPLNSRSALPSGRRRLAKASAAATIALLVAVASAGASTLHRLAPSVVAFASDGSRYAAWQAPGAPIVVLDTRAGIQREIVPPAGCQLHDEAEDGEPIESAAAGRFLLRCQEGEAQALLDVHGGKSVALPKKRRGPSDWYRVGTRYVMGVDVLYNIATGAKTRLHRVAELDRPGASTAGMCPAVRRLVTHNPLQGWHKGYAFHGNLFAWRFGVHGNVQLDRCHGRTILHARGGEDVCHGEPLHFNLRGGLFTWDTGCEGELADELLTESHPRRFRGSLYAYDLATHRRASWLLPRITIQGYEPITGTFGYSTHTAGMVFWIAARYVGGDKVPEVERSAVYAARL